RRKARFEAALLQADPLAGSCRIGNSACGRASPALEWCLARRGGLSDGQRTLWTPAQKGTLPQRRRLIGGQNGKEFPVYNGRAPMWQGVQKDIWRRERVCGKQAFSMTYIP